MLIVPNCYTRKCKFYLDIIQSSGTEITEDNYCKAFPKGIPYEIAYGENLHTEVYPGQENNIVYEKGEK